MSTFKKRRKRIKLKQLEEYKRLEEGFKKQNQTIKDMLETFYIIEKEHPEFETLNGDERIKFFNKIFNKIHKKD